jgi:type IV pilus assembly protein PilC
MSSFKYKAHDSVTGKKVSSVIEADNPKAVSSILKSQGLTPLEIQANDKSKSVLSGYFDRIKVKDRVIFSRQLSTLISSGLPLVQGLNSVRQQTKNPQMKSIIASITRDIENGSTLSNSLNKYPKVFNGTYTSLIEAGETSGTLDQSLERIALQQEKEAELIAKVRGAMAYPIIVLLVMVAVVGFMVLTVLPQVAVIYEDVPGVRLPLITRALLSLSDFVRSFWWLILLVSTVVVSFFTRWSRTDPGKSFIDGVKLSAWPIKNLFRKIYMARFSRSAATLISSGVPIIQTLNVTTNSIGNVHVEAQMVRIIEKIKAGKALSDAIKSAQYFDPLVPQMIKIGEDSGSMEQMMTKTSDYFEKEVDNQIKTVSTVIEPLLMVALGIIAILVVAAVLLPIYGLVGQNIIK